MTSLWHTVSPGDITELGLCTEYIYAYIPFMFKSTQIMHPQETDYSTTPSLSRGKAEVQGAVFLIWSVSDAT